MSMDAILARGQETASFVLPHLTREGGRAFARKFLERTRDVARAVSRQKQIELGGSEDDLTRVANRARLLVESISIFEELVDLHVDVDGFDAASAAEMARVMGLIEAYIDDFKEFTRSE